MMFLDAVHRTINNLDTCKGQTKLSPNATTILISKIDSTLSGTQLKLKKDLTKSVNRWIRETKDNLPAAKTNSNPNYRSQQTADRCNNLKKALSNINRLATDQCRTGTIDQQTRKKAVTRTPSIETQAAWLPSLTSSFQRSFSLRSEKLVDPREGSGDNRSRNKRQLYLSNRKSSYYCERHIKCGSDDKRVTNFANASGKGSLITAIFITLNIALLPLLPIGDVSAASITGLESSWLREKPATALSRQDSEIPKNTAAQSQFGQVFWAPTDAADTINQQRAFNALLDSLIEDTDELVEREVQTSREAGEKVKNGVDGSEGRVGDHFWIQRRRLERDRALEPPPWLRAQPMRRAFTPDLSDIFREDRYGLQAELAKERDEAAQEQSIRKSRELINPVYEDILLPLFNEAYNSKALFDELYSEVEARQAISQRPPASSSSSQKNSNQRDPAEAMLSQRLSQQQVASQSQSQDGEATIQNPLINNMDTEQLVVVGDEVSSGDELTPLDISQQLPRPSSQLGGDSSAVNGDLNRGLLISEQSSSPPDQAGDMSRVVGNSDLSIFLAPDMRIAAQSGLISLPIMSSIDAQSDDSQQQQASQFFSEQRAPLMSSFHVVEDIDQTDGALEAPAQPDPREDASDDQDQHLLEQEPGFMVEKRALRVPTRGELESNLDNNIRSTAIFPQFRETPNEQPTLYGKPNGFAASPMDRSSTQVATAVKVIESKYLTEEQLVRAATKIKQYLEDQLVLTRGTILGLYPMDQEQILIKLDVKKLTNTYQLMELIQNYDYARGYISVRWPQGSPQNPVPLLTAILRMLVLNKSGQTSGELANSKESLEEDAGDHLAPLEAAVQMARLERQRAVLTALAAADVNSQQRLHSGPNLDELQLRAVASQLIDDGLTPRSELLPQLSSPQQLYFRDQAVAASPMFRAYMSALHQSELSGKRPTETLSGWGSAAETNSSMASALFGAAPSSPSSAQLIGLVAALLSAFLVVKLVMRSSDKQILRRLHPPADGSLRSFWTRHGLGATAPATEAGQLSGSAALKAAEAGNPASLAPPAYSATVDELSSGDSECKKKVEALVDRLASLLSRNSSTDQHQESQVSSKRARVSDELDEASLLTETTAVNQPGRFRTSRSYIKSLIEALSQARAQFPAVNLLTGGGYAPAATPLEDDTCGSELTCGPPSDSSQTDLEADSHEPGVMVSQMDISAAHLILSYMEKHLDDKEQLQREWRELQTPAGSCLASGYARAALEKLAKVALEEDNKHKNRNNLVVPYDKNRVKLGTYISNRRRSPKLPSSGANCKSDYINASYIYDDEPRKPTHIITQGPTEQTVAQFWQMVWESGVSVLVMLTRLNENSAPMCHCYWPTSRNQAPTNAGAVGTSSAATSGTEEAATASNGLGKPVAPSSDSAAQSSSGVGTNGATNGRRGSVTSVFNTPLARLGASGQPIIANGDPTKNCILFFEVHHNRLLDEKPEDLRKSSTSLADASGSSQKSASGTTKFEVHLVSEHVSSNDYLVRNMCMINRTTGETRTITQFHYLAWPEAGVPENVKSLLHFRRKVHKSYRNLDSPILVHCSDGGGRSGTYVLVDIILERIRKGAKEIDPRATLEHLRDQRVGLCATQSQFEFVLMALAEEIQIILNALPR